MKLAHIRQKETFQEPVWHVLIALIVIIGSQLFLGDAVTFGLKYAIAGLETLLLIILGTGILRSGRRVVALLLVAVISIMNVASLVTVIYLLFSGAHVDGRVLLISAVVIYITNIIVFGLWYWELDSPERVQTDFQFPQKTANWTPTFFDYLYVSLTNATAFSPTDTMPLTHRSKLLMSLQSVASLVTIALVAARAVNILS
jgi:uncharacterized membrane protein